jgi:hypothetical protein
LYLRYIRTATPLAPSFSSSANDDNENGIDLSSFKVRKPIFTKDRIHDAIDSNSENNEITDTTPRPAFLHGRSLIPISSFLSSDNSQSQSSEHQLHARQLGATNINSVPVLPKTINDPIPIVSIVIIFVSIGLVGAVIIYRVYRIRTQRRLIQSRQLKGKYRARPIKKAATVRFVYSTHPDDYPLPLETNEAVREAYETSLVKLVEALTPPDEFESRRMMLEEMEKRRKIAEGEQQKQQVDRDMIAPSTQGAASSSSSSSSSNPVANSGTGNTDSYNNTPTNNSDTIIVDVPVALGEGQLEPSGYDGADGAATTWEYEEYYAKAFYGLQTPIEELLRPPKQSKAKKALLKFLGIPLNSTFDVARAEREQRRIQRAILPPSSELPRLFAEQYGRDSDDDGSDTDGYGYGSYYSDSSVVKGRYADDEKQYGGYGNGKDIGGDMSSVYSKGSDGDELGSRGRGKEKKNKKMTKKRFSFSGSSLKQNQGQQKGLVPSVHGSIQKQHSTQDFDDSRRASVIINIDTTKSNSGVVVEQDISDAHHLHSFQQPLKKRYSHASSLNTSRSKPGGPRSKSRSRSRSTRASSRRSKRSKRRSDTPSLWEALKNTSVLAPADPDGVLIDDRKRDPYSFKSSKKGSKSKQSIYNKSNPNATSTGQQQPISLKARLRAKYKDPNDSYSSSSSDSDSEDPLSLGPPPAPLKVPPPRFAGNSSKWCPPAPPGTRFPVTIPFDPYDPNLYVCLISQFEKTDSLGRPKSPPVLDLMAGDCVWVMEWCEDGWCYGKREAGVYRIKEKLKDEQERKDREMKEKLAAKNGGNGTFGKGKEKVSGGRDEEDVLQAFGVKTYGNSAAESKFSTSTSNFAPSEPWTDPCELVSPLPVDLPKPNISEGWFPQACITPLAAFKDRHVESVKGVSTEQALEWVNNKDKREQGLKVGDRGWGDEEDWY